MQTGAAAATRVVADTHVHLYPCYDLGAALANLARNLARTPADAYAAFLAERRDCAAFAALRDGKDLPRQLAGDVVALPEEGSLPLAGFGDVPVHLFAGRQLVTAERIEILALLAPEAPPEGLDAGRTIEAILAAGGIPVLGWSPGKWWGGRGRLARRLLERFGDSLLVGDTALRPACAPEPHLMRLARRRGSGVIAGTDPLPFPGEERLLGSYASVFEGTIDPARPADSARQLLRSAASRAAVAGSRSTFANAAVRWLRNARISGRRPACAA